MQVQLADNIAERSCIDFFAVDDGFQRLRGDPGFEGQHRLIKRRKFVNFADIQDVAAPG